MTKVMIPIILDVWQLPMAINKFLCITLNCNLRQIPLTTNLTGSPQFSQILQNLPDYFYWDLPEQNQHFWSSQQYLKHI
jgi:hypothetical protein